MSINNPHQSPNIDTSRFNSIVSANQGVFLNGITKNPLSLFEEPTYLGFTIEIDEESALFKDCGEWMKKMSDHVDIKYRAPLHEDVKNKIKMVFNSQDSVINPEDKALFIKQHYINSVSGLQSLTKKFVKFREDKLTIEMHEDISLFTTFLATAYNNMVYSYENGRVLVPENLQYFNLYIKISEVRNLTSIRHLISNNASDVEIARQIKKNTTCMIYRLTDCLFNFFEAVPFGDEIAQSGIDTPNVAHSVVTFDIYFKRVNLILNTPLVPNSKFFDNRYGTLKLQDPSLTTPESTSPVDPPMGPQNLSPAQGPLLNLDIVNNENPNVEDKKMVTMNSNENDPMASLDLFKNYTNKGASTIGTQKLENSDSLSEYEKAIKKLEEWNSDGVSDINQKFTSDNITMLDNEGNPVKDENGHIKTKTKEDIMSAGNTGTPNYKTAQEKSKGQWIKKSKEKYDQIRTANNEITDFYNKNISKLNSTIGDTLGGQLGNTVNGVTSTIANSTLQALQKYEKLLLTKKNELFNKALDEIKVSGKLLLDYNVYTDAADPMWKTPLSDLYSTMGNTVVDQLINGLKDGTNTSVFGGGSI